MAPVDTDDLAIEIEAPEGGKAFKLKVDWRIIAKSLGKGVLDVSYGNYLAAAKSLIDGVIGGLGKRPGEPATPAEQGWLWLHRGTMAALAATIRANPSLTAALADSDREMEAFLQAAQDAEPLLLTPKFFDRPADTPFFEQVKAGVAGWLRVLGGQVNEPESTIRRISEEFPIALDLEERQRRDEYAGFALFFQQTAVAEAAGRERAWRRYRASLVEEVRRPIFNFAADEPGAVSLEEIFVPLRAVYFRPLEEGRKLPPVRPAPDTVDRPPGTPVFVWLDDHIERWLKAAKSNDTLRVISGDPGSGKSAFGMMAAARWAREGRRVLRVPLHLIDFERDAFAAIRAYAEREEVLGVDPFEALSTHEPLILVLDGLDELSKVNEQTGKLARTFVDSLWQNIYRENVASGDQARVLTLLAGRPIVTHESTHTFNDPGQRVDILRLRVNINEYPQIEAPNDLRVDQRDLWWQNYGRAMRQSIAGLPRDYKNNSRQIDEITEHPLLNYLLALVRDEQLSSGAETSVSSVHDLYTRLFELLYKRRKGQLATRDQAEDRFDQSDYKRFLEEVAIAAWHGGDRSVTRDSIAARIETCDEETRAEFERHYGSLQSGIFAILSSFFVAPGSSGRHGIYTFTHKTFREFLTASRLAREVETVHDLLREPGNRFNHASALADWHKLTAEAAVDRDLLNFVDGEIGARADEATVKHWRDTLKGLFEENLRKGMPGHNEASDFRTAALRQRNAEIALFAMLTACHRGGMPPLDWQSKTGAEEFLRRTMPPRDRFVLSRLHGIDFSGQDLASIDLTGANLEEANLKDANLSKAVLECANLERANLTGANLSNARLQLTRLGHANLEHANLEGAILQDVQFGGARFKGANLKGARFEGEHVGGANFDGADLRGARFQLPWISEWYFRNANLEGVDFSNVAKLIGPNFEGANLKRANLFRKSLEGINFRGAKLEGANLGQANLEGANLEGANLNGAILAIANLKGANLTGANLTDLNLTGANLTGANLSNARLEGAILADAIGVQPA